jgi:hypothetical protein
MTIYGVYTCGTHLYYCSTGLHLCLSGMLCPAVLRHNCSPVIVG